ncbi:MAG: YegP family protein [Cytophagales bacterium]|nr:YegP family protein [Cytophagales bacterium]
MGKFEITQRTNNEYQFNLKAGNHEVILTSEGYTTMDACKGGVESVKKNALIDQNFERKESTNGKHFFNLKAANGQAIGRSEMYETKASMENGIASVMKNVETATLENQS